MLISAKYWPLSGGAPAAGWGGGRDHLRAGEGKLQAEEHSHEHWRQVWVLSTLTYSLKNSKKPNSCFSPWWTLKCDRMI